MRTLLLVALGAAVAVAVPAQESARRPNIVFVFSDDHAPHAIGAYGGRFRGLDPTPNIDRLAAQGTLFRNSFCTNSICGPSRAVILTGKHSHKNGFMKNGNRFDPKQPTFPKMLRSAGYRTAVIGKWHLGTNPTGFDYWDVLPGQGDYYNPMLIRNGERRRVEGYCTDIVTDLAIDWMEEQAKGGQPFMLMCQHKAPHRNWMPPIRHLGLYADHTIPEPETLFDDHADDASPARHQEMEIRRHMNLVYDLFVQPWDGWDPKAEIASDRSGVRNIERMTDEQRKAWWAGFQKENEAFVSAYTSGSLTDEEFVRFKYQRYMKNYLRCVRGVDDSVGRIMKWLEDNDLADNTILIYCSDQGFYLGDHGWYDKRWMYEESLRMPLIVRWPGVTRPGTVREELVQNLDYASTFLEIAGAPVPEAMQGRSLVPLLRGESPEWRDSIYYHYHGFPAVHMVARHYGIRTERYKLIRFYQFDEWELFDLKNDPDERRNLFGDPAHVGVVADLSEQLGVLRRRYEDDTDVKVMPAEWRAKYR